MNSILSKFKTIFLLRHATGTLQLNSKAVNLVTHGDARFVTVIYVPFLYRRACTILYHRMLVIYFAYDKNPNYITKNVLRDVF